MNSFKRFDKVYRKCEAIHGYEVKEIDVTRSYARYLKVTGLDKRD